MPQCKSAMLCCSEERASEDFEMDHHGATGDGRFASEIMTDARLMQSRHAPGTASAAARWIVGALARLGGGRYKLDGRRLTVH